MPKRQETCASCKFFCQDADPEARNYFDGKSGECRKGPPRDHFVWTRTRPYQWCGSWQASVVRTRGWQKLAAHEKDGEPVLLYKKGMFHMQSGMIVGCWNAAFNKWHDGGDKLFDRNDFTDWMALPEPPKS